MIFKFAFAFAFFLIIGISHSETRYVKAGSSNPVPPYTSWATASDSIQKCINISSEWDTIIAGDGVYMEILNLKKGIVLLGTHKFKTKIIAGNLPRPSPSHSWMISLNDSNTIKNMTITGNNNLTLAMSAFHQSPVYMVHTVLEGVQFDSLEGIGLLTSGLIKSSKIKCPSAVMITNPPFESTFTFELNEMLGNSMVSIYQSPFHPAGVSHITIRNNIVIFNNDQMKIVDDGLGHPNQTLDIYNNDFIVWGDIRFSVKLRTSYTFTNNTFHSRKFSTPLNERRPLFELYNQVHFHNNIFSNIRYIYNTSFNHPASFKYNVVWQGETTAVMDSTNITSYPMFTDINWNAVYSGAWPVAQNSTLLYNSKLQKYSPVIDKGDPLLLDKDGSRSDPGRYGGPWGESYSYVDTAPMPSLFGKLTRDDSTGAYRANWLPCYDTDFEKYAFYLHVEESNKTYFYGETRDTHAVIPYSNFVPGAYLLYGCTYDTAGNQSKWSYIGYDYITAVSELQETIEKVHKITGIYPNPFNAEAKVEYVIGNKGSTIFRIYDINGALLQTIDKGEQDEGSYNITLKMPNFASGVYFIRLEVKDAYTGKVTQTQSKKIVMVK